MKATTLDITWWAWPSLVVTQEMPSETICQRSWSSTSATATLNLLCSRAMSDLTTCRLSLSEWFWGRRSQTRQRPTVTPIPPLFPGTGNKELGTRLPLRLLRVPCSLFHEVQRRQVFRLLQAEVLQEAEGSAEQGGPGRRAAPPAAAAVGGEGVDRGLHVFERRFGDAGEGAGVHGLIGDEEDALHDELEPVQGPRVLGGRGLR